MKAIDEVITRWARSSSGELIFRSGWPLLEVLLIKRRADGLWAIPGMFHRPNVEFSPTLAKAFGIEKQTKREPGKQLTDEQKAAEKLREFLKNRKPLFEVFAQAVFSPRSPDC